jgi:hypothetical protein
MKLFQALQSEAVSILNHYRTDLKAQERAKWQAGYEEAKKRAADKEAAKQEHLKRAELVRVSVRPAVQVYKKNFRYNKNGIRILD